MKKIKEKQKGKKTPNQSDYNNLMEVLTEIVGTISESDPENIEKEEQQIKIKGLMPIMKPQWLKEIVGARTNKQKPK